VPLGARRREAGTFPRGDGLTKATLVLFAALFLGVAGAGPAAAGTGAAATERVSVSVAGGDANGSSFDPAVGVDGRLVAFSSGASNLVADDTNGVPDVFVRDRETGETQRVSLATDGAQATYASGDAVISASGRFVAFDSLANDLVAGDTNGFDDVFVHDRLTGTTERVSVSNDGTQGDLGSFGPTISADGRYVAFRSRATNLVPGDTNGVDDIFVRDLQSGTTQRVSVSTDGVEANDASGPQAAISANGGYVVFQSAATNLVDGDSNGAVDGFVRDLKAGRTERVSVATNGAQANGGLVSGSDVAISADGRYVGFSSDASNLVAGDTNDVSDVFLRDRTAPKTTRISVASNGDQANGDSTSPAMSADGSRVAFDSDAANLTNGDLNNAGDVFLRDVKTGRTLRESVPIPGTQPTTGDYSGGAAISPDGLVAFASFAANLVPNDTNGAIDVFLRFDTAPRVTCGDQVATITGTTGNDLLVGTSGDDVITGLGGNDTIRGGRGNDLICGGSGTDRIAGGHGDDRLIGGRGGDHITGGRGKDTLAGSAGNDLLLGGPQDDSLRGGRGTDTCFGGPGNDSITSCEAPAR
jgi:Tol biopolymer transport system component